MAWRRKRDGAMRARVEPDMIVADQRSAMMARLIEKADAGCLASAALVILLHCDRQRQHELVAVADALDIGDGDDAE